MIWSRARVHHFQPDGWTTGRASNGLRVEPAVSRLLIFIPARCAHRKVCHRRIDTIVGNFLHDRKAWSTVRAVGERITVTALGRIQHLRATGGAGRSIRSDSCAVFATYTTGNAEVLILEQLQDVSFYAFDPREWWCLAMQSRNELRDGARVSSSSNQNSEPII